MEQPSELEDGGIEPLDVANLQHDSALTRGVDELFLNQDANGLPPAPDAPRFVCVGRLVPQKGQMLLLDAVAKLASDGVKVELLFAGDGSLRPAAISNPDQENILAGRFYGCESFGAIQVNKRLLGARGIKQFRR